MAVITATASQTGTAGDDYLLGLPTSGNNHTLSGGEGDDLLIGDFFALVGAGSTEGTAPSLTSDNSLWTTLDNPDITEASTVPHTSAVFTGGVQYAYYQLLIVDGAEITLDIDYGANSPINGQANDYVVNVFIGSIFAFTIDSSNSTADPDGTGGIYYTLTATLSAPLTLEIGKKVGGNFVMLDADDTFILNLSMTGHAVANPAPTEGNDVLIGGGGGDILYGMGGDDTVQGGSGNDTMDGGTFATLGNTLSYSDRSTGMVFTLGAGGQGTVTLGPEQDIYKNF